MGFSLLIDEFILFIILLAILFFLSQTILNAG